MMTTVYTHPALISIPAALAVILIAGMFLNHLSKLGKSRDAEREASLTAMTKIGSDFTEALRELNESRVAEQAKQYEFYTTQSLCMQEIVRKCGGKMPKNTHSEVAN